jgi:hypothetical protein
MHNLPLTRGYYNGCLLTITSGPASGQSTRIVDYEHIGEIEPTVANVPTTPFPQKATTRLFRFRVMAFPRSDGLPLQVSSTRPPELADLAGAKLIVNGRPFNGTGVGYNPFAVSGTPRLTARESIKLGTAPTIMLSSAGRDLPSVHYPEIALTPNAAFFIPFDPTAASADFYGARYPIPIYDGGGNLIGYDRFEPLNPKSAAIVDRVALWRYQTFAGPGDADESYDAADFQNMALALQTVTPRSQGRVVTTTGTFEIDDLNRSGNFLRLDLEDLPLPSFHRPDLFNFWFHRLVDYARNPNGSNASTPDEGHVLAVLQPYGVNGIREPAGGDDPTGVQLEVRDQIVALKRKISLRPLREDHPNFDGSNPQSRPRDLSGISSLVDDAVNILIDYWEAVGPWDVDNDNDGVPDSVWVDVGEPVCQAEDGTLYKPLFAFLVMDLDSRLNVNAHGLVEHLRMPQLSALEGPPASGNLVPGPNLSHDLSLGAGLTHSDLLPHGLGYGPAEISLRPVLSPALPGNVDPVLAGRVGNPAFDDYARLLVGRPRFGDEPSVWGRHGSVNIRGSAAIDWFNNALAATEASKVQPGIVYDASTLQSQAATVDRLALLKFIGHPWWLSNFFGQRFDPMIIAPVPPVPSAFGTPPDLMGRYALGLDYAGQPVVEAVADYFAIRRFVDPNGDGPLLFDSAYELNLSNPMRRDVPDPAAVDQILQLASDPTKYVDVNDDAPFATADLERILRSHDADAGILPDRLWNVVDSFDPVKLVRNQPLVVETFAQQMFSTTSATDAQRLAAAQQLAGVSRRLVTTDSYDLPVPGASFLGRLIYGADGQPGLAGQDDDGDDPGDGSLTDEPDEIGWGGSDDYYPVMNEITTPGAPPAGARLAPEHPTIVDLLKYRVQYERLKINQPIYGEAELSAIVQQLLASEVIAGKRMDLNRPFGDGVDNGDQEDNDSDGTYDEPGESGDTQLNGVVDDPLEAGEPFLDVNGNGKWDDGIFSPAEPFIDLNANGQYDAPRDQLWPELTLSGTLGEPIAFDYTNGHGEPVHPSIAASFSPSANVRNLESQGRQLFARHLYCLMLLLVDENYIAPIDGGDPQVALYMNTATPNSFAANLSAALAAAGWVGPAAEAEARRILARKLTCRMIAQWAINCVDARDADVIMTPFEYDENPWDGWGCLDSDGVNVPLDGDLATNENLGEVLDWNTIAGTNQRALITVPTPVILNQTRGVVWGAERPELLINETLALHDRRATDETLPPSERSILDDHQPPNNPQDQTLDQRLKPQGSLFVELYNPWSADGQRPAELYRYSDGSPHPFTGADGQPAVAEGVLLHRLSNLGVTSGTTTSYSPVWRMAVVQQSKPSLMQKYQTLLPAIRSTVPDGLVGVMARTGSTPPEFRMLNLESPEFVPDGEKADAERWVYFVADPDKFANQPLRIPAVPTRSGAPAGGLGGGSIPAGKQYFLARNAALPNTNPADNPTHTDPAMRAGFIAPILPGHYAVVGSAGMQYKTPTTSYEVVKAGDPPGVLEPRANEQVPRFVTTIGRLMPPSSSSAGLINTDDYHARGLRLIRRIELAPRRDPWVQQLLVDQNGGAEFVQVDPADPTSLVNVTKQANDTGQPLPVTHIQPCVAIPIEGLNITEPVEGYVDSQGRVYDRYPYDDGERRQVRRNRDYGELEFSQFASMPNSAPLPFDVPLDVDLDLCRNGTTANYRSLHLQRLANPLLPWNPLPTFPDGSANSDYKPALPVNPYLTIDSMGVDMTAFNGATILERTDLPTSQAQIDFPGRYEGAPLQGTDNPNGPTGLSPNEWHWCARMLPFEGRAGGTQNRAPLFQQHLHLKSLERGYHSKEYQYAQSSMTVAQLQNDVPNRVPRVLWEQERSNVKQPVGGTSTAPMLGENRLAGGGGGDLVDAWHHRFREAQLTRAPYNFDLAKVDTILPSREHIVDFVLEQTLGFQNRLGFGYENTFTPPVASREPLAGKFYTNNDNVPPNAKGAPKIDADPTNLTPADVTDESTFPWLAWNNRPYVSAEEILQVPAASSAELLRPGHYSTVNPDPREITLTGGLEFLSPYGSDGLDGNPAGMPPVPFVANMPFGHLLSFFAAASQRPDTLDVDGDGDTSETLPAAPNFYRLLEYVEVPSRYVGTDDLLSPEVFNDNPLDFTVADNIADPLDPRINFQPPFNKVSRERDPGRVNLNTVVGQRTPPVFGTRIPVPPRIWSDVFDGLMHRYQDDVLRDSLGNVLQLGHFGPAWRDVVLSRRGYAQFDAAEALVDAPGAYPDTFTLGLNRGFPTVFANPFRSPDAGELVPLEQMQQHGVDASWLRVHPRTRGLDGGWGNGFVGAVGVDDDGDGMVDEPGDGFDVDDNGDGLASDAREAGWGDDQVSHRGPGDFRAIPEEEFADLDREYAPLFSEMTSTAAIDAVRNPSMMYQPMTRLGNLVTTRSNVYAIWVTVGYFEVEPAPDWNTNENNVRARFGATTNDDDPATVYGRALYDRVYPEGYMLGEELGVDTGEVRRQRGFYIIDRTEPVGFKPGDDLNVDRVFRVRRRID